MREVQHLSVRYLPLLSILVCFSGGLIFVTNGINMGKFGLASVSFLIISHLFAVSSVLALIQCYRARSWPINKAVWIHSLAVSLATVTLSGYLGYYGVIGLKTWLY